MLRSIIIIFCVFAIFAKPESLIGQNWNLESKLISDTPDALDFAGISIDISGAWMVMGAWWDDMNDSSAGMSSAGAVYVYQQDDDKEWILHQKLYSSNPEVAGYFGYSVAIDGSTLIVGAYNEDEMGGNQGNVGAVYLYELATNGSWQEMQRLASPDAKQGDLFGYTLAISHDRILIGAPKHKYDLLGQNEMIGAGAAYLFKRQGGIWDFEQKLIASDRNMNDEFGKFLDISNHYLIIGAEDHDQGFLFDAGAAYIFEFDAAMGAWSETQQIFASDATSFKDFGWDVAIDGNQALIGASAEVQRPDGSTGSNTGAVYAFSRNTQGVWVETQKIYIPDFAANDFFGRAIDMQDKYAIIGAALEDEDQQGQMFVSGAGSAYVFRRDNDQWRFEQKLIGTHRQIDDFFGGAVAIDWPYIAVGASQADVSTTSNNIIDAGAGYIYGVEQMTTPNQENTPVSHYQIAPNPSSQFLIVNSNAQPPLKISLFSAAGQHMADLPTDIEIHDLESLATGIYLISIMSAHHCQTIPWIKY